MIGADPFSGHLFLFRGKRGSHVTWCILLLEVRQSERLILLESLVKFRPPGGNCACACLDGLSVERSNGNLPWRGEHELCCGQNAFTDQLVNRTDTDAEAGRGLL